jgi:multiple sugar transport system substrate-binding protein
VLAAGAATVATTFVSACGGQTGTPDVKALGPVTVRFTPANGPGGDVQAFEPLLPQYMQERPNVKVELEVIADGGWTKVNALLMADSAADVMRVNDDSVYQWGSTGKFTHLDPFINKSMKRDDYFPPEWKDMLVDGKQYSMQPHFGVNLFVYSASLFKKAGISAPTDWNKTWDWQTFVDACRKIATPNGAPGEEVYAVTFPANYVVW